MPYGRTSAASEAPKAAQAWQSAQAAVRGHDVCLERLIWGWSSPAGVPGSWGCKFRQAGVPPCRPFANRASGASAKPGRRGSTFQRQAHSQAYSQVHCWLSRGQYRWHYSPLQYTQQYSPHERNDLVEA